MDPTAVTKVADYASSQSDRWLFIALLVIGGMSIWFMAKWFMTQLSNSHDSTAAAQQQFANYLTNQAAENVKVISECRVAIQRSNELLEEHQREAK
jgi:hypothetical protein